MLINTMLAKNSNKSFLLQLIIAYLRDYCTVEAPVSGHPQKAETACATGAGRLRECVN